MAAGLAQRCEIQVSYAIGVAEPTSISVNTFGTGTLDDEAIVGLIREHFDLRPRGLIDMLDLEAADLSQYRGLRSLSAGPKRASPGSAPIGLTPSRAPHSGAGP